MLKKINKISTLKVNLISNYFASVVIAILSILFVPIYLRYIGAEGYGLIGVFASLQVILSVLEGGLGGALTKEIAHHSANASLNGNKIRDLVKTLGTVYWILALIIGVIAVCLSPIIAQYWVKPVNLNYNQIVNVFILLSLALIFNLPIGFYSGGFMGLQKHLILNVLKLTFTVIKNGGSVLVLMNCNDKLQAFFIWNLGVNITHAIILKFTLWQCIPKGTRKAEFNKQELRDVWKFAMGITGISITALILTQVDRIILSKMLPLNQFGFYSLASSITVIIYQIIQPINQSFFPKFVGLTSKEQNSELIKIYRLSFQVVSLLIVPATLIVVFYSRELLFFLTSDFNVTQDTWLILSVLALGTGLNALLNIPYQLSLAFSWTKYAFYQNILLIILMTPLTIWLTLEKGALGGAISWLILNLIMVNIGSIVIHQRILKTELKTWYIYGFVLPIITNVVYLWIFKTIFILDQTHKIVNLGIICCFGLFCVITNSIMLPEIRTRLHAMFFKKKLKIES